MFATYKALHDFGFIKLADLIFCLCLMLAFMLNLSMKIFVFSCQHNCTICVERLNRCLRQAARENILYQTEQFAACFKSNVMLHLFWNSQRVELEIQSRFDFLDRRFYPTHQTELTSQLILRSYWQSLFFEWLDNNYGVDVWMHFWYIGPVYYFSRFGSVFLK